MAFPRYEMPYPELPPLEIDVKGVKNAWYRPTAIDIAMAGPRGKRKLSSAAVHDTL